MDTVQAAESRFADVPNYDYDPEFVDTGDVEMAYVDTGAGEETFLCLHGEPTWGFLYRKMIPTLESRGRVVVPDLPGFGRSEKFADRDDYTYDRLYDALETFLLELDLRDVTLVCQDWGGLLGLPVAANNPERFARLVPMNTGLPDGTGGMPEVWHEFLETVETAPDLDIGQLVAGGCASDLDDAVLDAYRAPFPTEEHLAGARTLPGLVPLDPDDEAAAPLADARERFADWEKPVFVLFAESDPITRPARDDLAGVFPTADDQPETWISGAAHFLQEDAGETVAEEIVAFVDRT
ncbi:haloalkane dehalogenase [Salarchaeum japonicum]|uniref:Haloalkane dehalogenase n=1 Tax=Salarchaeum japonicum TaxID=555573 RepID=A0AAV3T3Q5_9EURY|nr:haloalkane dehalogenase [Salarchaeum japonicum]